MDLIGILQTSEVLKTSEVSLETVGEIYGSTRMMPHSPLKKWFGSMSRKR